MSRKKISLILITKNESKNIEKHFNWINKLKNIEEIIIIDDYSTDKTKEALKKTIKNKEIKFYKRKLNNNFAEQRNFGISKSKYNWIFSIDVDEQPSKKLIGFIDNIDNNQYKNYSFKRKDFFIGKEIKHGENNSLYFTRLFNKKYGKFIGKVHEKWQSNSPTKKTNLTINHYPHPNLSSLFQKINFYSTIRAQEMYQQKIKTNLLQIIFFPVGKFIQNYFLRLGFLDGTQGIILALSMSFHVFLNKSKLWHLYQK